MRQMLERVLEENFEGGQGSLEFSCSEVALILAPGALYEGAFAVYAVGEGETEGCVLTTDPRMECLTGRFQGSEDYIGYRFHGETLGAGEEVSGEFHVISNRGEYHLPFVVLVDGETADAEGGEIRSLLQFTALARDNWQEALKLFYSDGFPGLLGNPSELGELYRGLSARPGNSHNLEEFLIAAGQKSPVEYFLRESSLYRENPEGVAEDSIIVVRDGWGCTRLKAEAEGEFISLGKDLITEKDFLGNRCRIPVYIDSSRLHHGKNTGRIRLTGEGQVLTAEVNVRAGEEERAAGSARRERKKLLIRLLELYQSYRLQKISAYSWQRESGTLVERLVAMNDKDVMARLLQAQLLITRERFHEGNWILEHSLELLDSQDLTDEEYGALYAYYLYLTTLLNPEAWHLRQAAEEMEELYRRMPEVWQIAWILLSLSPEYNRNPSARWDFLEKQFAGGKTSPLLYLEAILLLNENPALLRILQSHELQVLGYGCRKGALSAPLVEQMLYLAGRKKEFSPVLLRILMDCYHKKSDPDVLREVCSQLIKGGLTGPKYLRWYELGLEQELRLTKLYEYYMMSIDLESDKEPSKKALLYFSYQNNLDYERTAFLYHYVVKHREENQELYETYRERILYFVLDQIRRERINRDLAYLYQELLSPELFEERMARALTKLLFAWSLKVEDPLVCKVLVYRPDILQISEYPVKGGRAWIALYREDEKVFLEDTEGNRYAADGPKRWELKRLMEPGGFLGLTCYYWLSGFTEEELTGFGTDGVFRGKSPSELSEGLAFVRYYWEHEVRREPENSEDSAGEADLADTERPVGEEDAGESGPLGRLTAEELYCGRLLADSPAVSQALRQKTLLQLLRYYRTLEDDFSWKNCLEKIDPANLDAYGRRRVLDELADAGEFSAGYDWIETYGPDFADPDTLLKLLTHKIERVDFWDDAGLLQSAVCVFRKGKYNSSTMRYLALHYTGPSEELIRVWRAARSLDVDISRLSEILLLQTIYSGCRIPERMEVFEQYVSHGPRPEVEMSFLRDCAWAVIARSEAPQPVVLREIARLYACGEKVGRGLKLAYLYAFADGHGIPGETSVLERILRDLLEEGIYLESFRKLPVGQKLLEPMQDRSVVEYRCQRSGKVWIRSRIDGGAESREEMRPVCRGLYARDYILFYGEKLSYVIEQEQNGLTETVSEGEYVKEETPSDAPGCCYELLNDILMARELEEYDTMDRLIEDYYHKEYLAERLFRRR